MTWKLNFHSRNDVSGMLSALPWGLSNQPERPGPVPSLGTSDPAWPETPRAREQARGSCWVWLQSKQQTVVRNLKAESENLFFFLCVIISTSISSVQKASIKHGYGTKFLLEQALSSLLSVSLSHVSLLLLSLFVFVSLHTDHWSSRTFSVMPEGWAVLWVTPGFPAADRWFWREE